MARSDAPMRRSGRSGERRGRDEIKHWLGEGADGQACLFDDLDPYRYAIDGAICGVINQVIAHGGGRGQIAVLVPPQDCVDWQIAYLGERFGLEIWANEGDELLETAANAFGASIFEGEAPPKLQHAVRFFLFTHYAWSNVQELAAEFQETKTLLAEDGELHMIACAEGAPNSTSSKLDGVILRWADGTSLDLSRLVNGEVFGIDAPSSFELASLGKVGSDFDFNVTDFLRRHRTFFGKNARDLSLARMREADFASAVRDADAERRYTVLLSWNAS